MRSFLMLLPLLLLGVLTAPACVAGTESTASPESDVCPEPPAAPWIAPPLPTVLSDGPPPLCSQGSTCFVTAPGSMTQRQGVCAANSGGGYACCLGCIDGRGNCQAGTAVGACGIGGAACTSCADTNACTNDYCNQVGHVCGHNSLSNSTSCDSGVGHCNPATAVCCDYFLVNTCATIADPLACATACTSDPSVCTQACVPVCPPLTAPDPVDGVCIPFG